MTEMTKVSYRQLPYSAAAQAFLACEPRLSIGNEWVASSEGATTALELSDDTAPGLRTFTGRVR